MKAVLLKGNGGFEQLEYREDVATPAPGAGEVLIRVTAAEPTPPDAPVMRTVSPARRPVRASMFSAAD